MILWVGRKNFNKKNKNAFYFPNHNTLIQTPSSQRSISSPEIG